MKRLETGHESDSWKLDQLTHCGKANLPWQFFCSLWRCEMFDLLMGCWPFVLSDISLDSIRNWQGCHWHSVLCFRGLTDRHVGLQSLTRSVPPASLTPTRMSRCSAQSAARGRPFSFAALIPSDTM